MDRAAYVILDVLHAGPRAVGALADELHLDQSTVVRQVAALERKGLVERSAGGRAALVALTPDGEEQLAEVRAGRVGALLAPWPAHDRTELARLLVELNAALDRRLREPPTG
ncbi:MAG: MarR family transcriptional regulator [Ilumatobacteraceae bacterium]